MPQESFQAFWFWGSAIVLALALYYPVTRFVWVIRVRRFERKNDRQTTAEERQLVLRQSRFISIPIVLFFAFLFTRTLIVPS